MKFYLKCSFCSLSLFAVCMVLVLTSCGDSGPKTIVGVFGEPATYAENTFIEYPDFSLRFIEKKVSKAEVPEEVATYSFQLTAGTYQQLIEWHDASYRIGSYELFLYKGQKFALDLKYSDFLDKELADGEVIIWTQPQYEQFKQNKSQAWKEKIRKLSAPAVEYNLLQQRKKAGAPLFEIYKEYHQAIDMAEQEYVGSFLSDESPIARAKQADYLISHHNPSLDTLSFHDAVISTVNARLYLSFSSAKEIFLIGVEFIKRQDQWKIASEKIRLDNVAGKEWMKRFMQEKQGA